MRKDQYNAWQRAKKEHEALAASKHEPQACAAPDWCRGRCECYSKPEPQSLTIPCLGQPLEGKPEPQAQAAEPEVHHTINGVEFITLQAHREAMAMEHTDVAVWRLRAAQFAEAIAKRDAALDACGKDAARYRFIRSANAPVYVEWYEASKEGAYLADEELDAAIDAAIQQAQETRK